MKKKNIKTQNLRLYWFVVFFSAALLNAQNIKILTLNDCIHSALKNYPSLTAFKKTRQSKAAVTKSLQSQTRPEADLSFRGGKFRYNNYGYQALDSRLQLSWDVGAWAAKLKKTGLTQEAIAGVQARQNRLNLILRVKRTFWELLTAKKTLSVARLSESYVRHHLKVSRKLFALGQVRRLDLYFSQSELAKTRERILTAQSQITSGQIRLSALIGIKIASNDSLPVPLLPTKLFNAAPEDLLEQARKFNPALSLFERRIQLLNRRVNRIKKSRWPKVFVAAAWVYDNDPASGGNYGAVLGGLQIPVFDWGNRSYRMQALQLQAQALSSARRAFLLELDSRLKALANRIRYFKQFLKLKEKSIAQAQKTYDFTELNYRRGLASNSDVLLARKMLIEAKYSKEKLVFNLQVIGAEIENLLGKNLSPFNNY